MVRNFAETVRRVAERGTQNSVANRADAHENTRIAAGIGSSSVVRIKDKEWQDIHRAVEIGSSLQSEKRAAFPTVGERQVAEEIQQCERREFQQQFRNVADNHGLKNSYSEQSNTSAPPRRHDQQENQQRANEPIEKQNPRPAESRTTRPTTQQNFPWQLRERMRPHRAERDEAVRRELAVGTGPEVRRP
jgi:hypothetical protein